MKEFKIVAPSKGLLDIKVKTYKTSAPKEAFITSYADAWMDVPKPEYKDDYGRVICSRCGHVVKIKDLRHDTVRCVKHYEGKTSGYIDESD